jgi:hypothetical protein
MSDKKQPNIIVIMGDDMGMMWYFYRQGWFE